LSPRYRDHGVAAAPKAIRRILVEHSRHLRGSRPQIPLQLSSSLPLCHRMFKKFLPLLFLPLLFVGCTTTFTNLTPQQQARNANNLYPVEVALDTRQATLRWESIRPQIVVGTEFYSMHPTLLMTNRWE